MAIFKCKMCGGDLEISEGISVIKCGYCETMQTIPSADNEKKIQSFNRANKLRMSCDFDRAASVYESIITEFPEEAEAYWGLCLCNYGIEYVDDPATGEKMPTCHRASFKKLTEDENFNCAIDYADMVAKRQYTVEAGKIDRIMQDILALSKNESPYDIFICYKELDDKKERTIDSLLAEKLYELLTAKGYKIFFARISLEDKIGMQYEPYIFAALNSAKIMLSLGTKYEYFHAVWVKNEWSRFLRLAAKDKSKVIIPCYKDCDPYVDLPPEFKALQAQDLGKVGAESDLIRGIEKILGSKSAAPQQQQKVVVNTSTGATTGTYLTRAKMALEAGDFNSVNKFCENVLNMDPENSDAYFYKLLAELKVRSSEALEKGEMEFNEKLNYQRAHRFGNKERKDWLEYCVMSNTYNKATSKMISAKTSSDFNEAAEIFSGIVGFKDAEAQYEKCIEFCKLAKEEESEKAETAQKQAVIDSILREKESANTYALIDDVIAQFSEVIDYPGAKDYIRDCIKTKIRWKENWIEKNKKVKKQFNRRCIKWFISLVLVAICAAGFYAILYEIVDVSRAGDMPMALLTLFSMVVFGLVFGFVYSEYGRNEYGGYNDSEFKEKAIMTCLTIFTVVPFLIFPLMRIVPLFKAKREISKAKKALAGYKKELKKLD